MRLVLSSAEYSHDEPNQTITRINSQKPPNKLQQKNQNSKDVSLTSPSDTTAYKQKGSMPTQNHNLLLL